MEGKHIGENTLIISQLADDTFLFLKDYSQVSVALGLFNIFSIKVKRCVKYLRVDIFRSGSDHLFRNLLPILDQIKQIFMLLAAERFDNLWESPTD